MTSIKKWQKALYELKVAYSSLLKDLQRIELELQDAELSDNEEDFEEKAREVVRDVSFLRLSTITDLSYHFRQLAESVIYEQEQKREQEEKDEMQEK